MDNDIVISCQNLIKTADDINVVFTKPYSAGPTVVVTPYEPAITKYSYIITSITNLNFTVKVINNTGSSAGAPVSAPFRFSYMVIE